MNRKSWRYVKSRIVVDYFFRFLLVISNTTDVVARNTTLTQLRYVQCKYCDLPVFIKNCIKLVIYLDIIWPCILIIMIIK